jgi:hypothetical protein
MGIVTDPARARHAWPPISHLKLHLRELRLAGQTYRVVTLRPDVSLSFSTNFIHQTWHIVTDQQGSRLLARLLWGLAFQQHPRTVVLIQGKHIRPTPFEGERSDPFLLLPAHLTPIDHGAFRYLKSRLKSLGPPDRTIRWQTFGMDLALEQESLADAAFRSSQYEDNKHLRQQERMGRCGGFIYYSAPPAILRQEALSIHSLTVKQGGYANEMNYHYLAETRDGNGWGADGEVQIFWEYQDRVAAAVEARRQLVSNPNQPIHCETLQESISRRRDTIRRRRRRCRLRQNTVSV